MARRRSVLIGVGVLLIGCSGGTDGADEPRPAGSDGETQSALSSAGVVSATNRIGEQYGPAVGFAVTVGALDRGYSVSQIVDASSLSDDGSIDGVAPAGPVLGVLSAPVEPAGFRRPAVAADDPPLSDFRVTVLNTTIEGIYDKAFPNPDPQIAFDEATAAARVDLVDGDFDIIFGVLFLVGRGYTLEQAMQGYFFGTLDLDGLGCLRLKDELSKGQPIKGALSICPPLEAADESPEDTQPVASDDAAAEDQAVQTESADDRPRGLYNAAIVDFLDPDGDAPSSIMSNLVTIDLSGDTPEIAVSYGARLTPDHYDTAPDVTCQMDVFIEVPRTKLADPVFDGGRWTGTVGFEIGGFDGTCSAGSTDNEMLGPGTFSVAFVATESTLSGTLEAAGDVLSFDGALAS